MKLFFVSSNENKYYQLQRAIKELEMYNLDIPEYQGTHEDIVKGKCKYAYDILKCPLIVEDTSLSFEAWKGMPGPYIKPFMEHNNCEDIYNLLKDNKNALATCIIGYIDSEGIILFKGSTKGHIVKPIGDYGFSWDCIFQAEGQNDGSFATMKEEERIIYSPRNKAAESLKVYIKSK